MYKYEHIYTYVNMCIYNMCILYTHIKSEYICKFVYAYYNMCMSYTHIEYEICIHMLYTHIKSEGTCTCFIHILQHVHVVYTY